MQFNTSTSLLIAVCVLFGTGTYGQDFNAILKNSERILRNSDNIMKNAGNLGIQSNVKTPQDTSSQNFGNPGSGSAQNSVQPTPGQQTSRGSISSFMDQAADAARQQPSSGNTFTRNGKPVSQAEYCRGNTGRWAKAAGC
jgi:hypothetical protein